ncbi:MAG: hypothetical protein Q8Q20_05610 [bacterium]|nr:hypothetical protein [bacterium]
MEEYQAQNTAKMPGKKFTMKRKISLFLILLVILGIGYGFFWIKQTNTLRADAENVIEQANQYEAVKTEITTEKSRCEGFISQQQGDFGSFEYCTKFIEWANTLPALK